MRYELRDATHRLIQLDGQLISHVSTDDGEKPRWMELSVYERDAGGYVYYSVGKSSIYHRLTCSSGRGVQRTDPDLTDKMPCNLCDPPDGLPAYKVEGDLINLFRCADLEAVEKAATSAAGYSRPVRELLQKLPQRGVIRL